MAYEVSLPTCIIIRTAAVYSIVLLLGISQLTFQVNIGKFAHNFDPLKYAVVETEN